MNPEDKQHVISFGRGVRLMSEEYYIRELRPFGINTTRAFRALCRAICCPNIIFGSVGFVDPAIFQLCMKNLSLPGNKDFVAPNSYMKLYLKARKNFRNRVDPAEVRKNWRTVVKAITDSRRIRGLSLEAADRAAIRTAADELSRFVLTMIPSHQQERADGTKAQ